MESTRRVRSTLAAIAWLGVFLGTTLPVRGRESVELRASEAGVQTPTVRLGRVVGDQVNLRAGPSTAYEVVATLARETRLAVIGSAYGWYRVRPQVPVAVYISTAFLERKDGDIAVVTRDRVNVRARPSLTSTVCGQVHRGDPLRVLEVEDRWAKVAAPAQLAFYLHGKFVSFDGEGGAPGAAAQTDAPEAGGAPAAAPVPLDPKRLLEKAVASYNAEIAKPRIAEMDFTTARRLFERVLERTDDPTLVAAARSGLRRIAAFERLAREYERRRRAIEEAMAGPEQD